jgi:preprotein translocase subunit SecD
MLKSIRIIAVFVSFLFFPYIQLCAQESTATLEFRLADDDESSGWTKMELPGNDKPIFVSSETSLNGGHIEKVSFYKDPKGNPTIGLTLTDEGAKAMEATTSNNHKKKLAIVLNGQVVSAPTIQATITKEVQITGRFDRDELLAIFNAIVLGELP